MSNVQLYREAIRFKSVSVVLRHRPINESFCLSPFKTSHIAPSLKTLKRCLRLVLESNCGGVKKVDSSLLDRHNTVCFSVVIHKEAPRILVRRGWNRSRLVVFIGNESLARQVSHQGRQACTRLRLQHFRGWPRGWCTLSFFHDHIQRRS